MSKRPVRIEIPDAFDDRPPAERTAMEIGALSQRDDAHGLRFLPTLECDCMKCSQPVARELVVMKVSNPHAVTDTRSVTRAFCQHCDVLYRWPSVLIGGVWKIAGDPEIVTNEIDRLQFFNEVRIGQEKFIRRHRPALAC